MMPCGYHYCYVPSFWYVSWRVIPLQFVVVPWLSAILILWFQTWKNLSWLSTKVPCKQAPLSFSSKYVFLSYMRFAVWYGPVQRKSNMWLNWNFNFVSCSRTKFPTLSSFVRSCFRASNSSFSYFLDHYKCNATSCKSSSLYCNYLARIASSLPIVWTQF